MNAAPASPDRARCVIVGGGWAGLSAAVALARAGARPLLLEAARQLGGRARAMRFGPFRVDNGQHLLFGSAVSVLELLALLGVPEHRVFRRLPPRLLVLGGDGRRMEIATAPLPAPLHLLGALIAARGLSVRGRLAAIRLMARMRGGRSGAGRSRPLAAFLAEQRQPRDAIEALWRPFCYAALGADPAEASTVMFLEAARRTLFRQRQHSQLLQPVLDLSACLPHPATDYIEARGGEVRLAARVEALEIADGRATGVRVNGDTIAAEHVVLATSADVAATLLRPHRALADAAYVCDALHTYPICTLYLRYPEHVGLERDLVGLLDALPQWLYDRGRASGDRGLIAAVISGPGRHMRLTNDELTARIVADIARRFPKWPPPLETRLVRERRAALAPEPGVESLRPGHATPVRGLWLAGDYTATGLPGTLEGAVTSGLACAEALLNDSR
jgi:squalene-associated FAD-dependent desaturase